MLKSIFHPSGNASITMVKEFIQLLPSAVVVADAETTEILAYSPAALELFGGTGDRLYHGKDFHLDGEEWATGLAELEKNPGTVMSRATMMQDFNGQPFPALLRFVLTRMAGRRVFISSIERGLPDPDYHYSDNTLT